MGRFKEITMRNAVGLIGGLALLAGCAVGPDYQKPETPEDRKSVV